MATFVFRLPDIGEGIAESEIAHWHAVVGDRLVKDPPLVDMLTHKAAVEIRVGARVKSGAVRP